MLKFLNKKKQPVVLEDKLEDLKEKFEDPNRAKQVEVTGTVIQREKAREKRYGPVEDIFHVLVKTDTVCEYADNNGYLHIQESGRCYQLPLARVGDKVTIGYWTNLTQLQIYKFDIDFAARNSE